MKSKTQKNKAFMKKLQTLTIGGKAVQKPKPKPKLVGVSYLCTIVHHKRHAHDESRAFAV